MITAETLKEWRNKVPRCEDTCPRFCFSRSSCYDDRCNRYKMKVEHDGLRQEIDAELEVI